MQLRTRVGLLLGTSVLVAVVAAAAAIREFRSMERAAAMAERAQSTLLEARALLGLTYEYALYGQPRTAQQWRLRYDALGRAVTVSDADRVMTEAPDLEGEISVLAALFDRLTEARRIGPSNAVAARRIELLTDNLIAETQTILDSTYLWVASLAAQRTHSERRLATLAIAIPVLAVLSLGLLGLWLTRRITLPLRRLQRLMSVVAAGDLGVRSQNASEDEIGELSRAFDAMTAALQEALAQRESSERQMRLIADNLPARVTRFDRDQRLLYANLAACRVLGAEEESPLLGRPLRELQPAIHDQFEPHIDAVLRGEPQSFVISKSSDEAGPRWSGIALIPDRGADGAVHGWYAMIQDITEATRSRQRIELALAEKEVLLREVHHRVKNNMQVITSLLALQAGQTDNAELQAMLEESRDRIRSMALIHEKLYQNAVFSAVDFGDYLRTLVQMMAATQAQSAVTAHVDADAVQLDINRAVPAGLIVNELVSNSFKHGFPDGRPGHIEVSLSVMLDRRVRLRVADDGVGAKEPALQGGESLGLRLVRLLAGQLDAELEFVAGPGFSCTLEFEAGLQTKDDKRDA